MAACLPQCLTVLLLCALSLRCARPFAWHTRRIVPGVTRAIPTLTSPRDVSCTATPTLLSMATASTPSSTATTTTTNPVPPSPPAAADPHHLRHFLAFVEEKERDLQDKVGKTKTQLVRYETSLQQVRQLQQDVQQGRLAGKTQRITESAVRSVVKSLLWRVVAGSVTLVTTLRFAGSWQAAWKVVGADFASKAFTMFLGERLMNQSQAGRQGGADHVQRSLAKALLWRLFAISNTLCLAVFVAKDISVASKIASTDAVVKTGLMFAYERLWAHVSWGKHLSWEEAPEQPAVRRTAWTSRVHRSVRRSVRHTAKRLRSASRKLGRQLAARPRLVPVYQAYGPGAMNVTSGVGGGYII
jgi:uncharacterized membrane protein